MFIALYGNFRQFRDEPVTTAPDRILKCVPHLSVTLLSSI